jgi:tRNA-(ms[2]io[6]A)-hydroxylase
MTWCLGYSPDNSNIGAHMTLTIDDICLQTPTPEAWLLAACQQIPALLADHAACEKKAASMALTMMKYFQQQPDTLARLSKIAREELVHYEQVLRMLKKLQLPFQARPASRYAKSLWEHAASEQPLRLIDMLMICAVIEARSCERFLQLAPRLPDPLGVFYQKLYAAEKRHAEVYLAFALQKTDESTVKERLERMLHREKDLISGIDEQFGFHSGRPAVVASPEAI